jgi:hypothetical protein
MGIALIQPIFKEGKSQGGPVTVVVFHYYQFGGKHIQE